ncbi:uncharacterized protein EDB93DRAFT_1334560 [Suillus bovinus]|uniref:uncharacterized protein n=1 Tax=Suillus bovinus TaxID=48563 RepID=UPI001B88716D|nr:uncharacterized protein EDB93DRAFT_1334560 [Suillus bovinus]KAG2158667.1 hypothetical protein EDB93DRAFT_1334560 [Suillus bovinus]
MRIRMNLWITVLLTTSAIAAVDMTILCFLGCVLVLFRMRHHGGRTDYDDLCQGLNEAGLLEDDDKAVLAAAVLVRNELAILYLCRPQMGAFRVHRGIPRGAYPKYYVDRHTFRPSSSAQLVVDFSEL